jgi:16S rRNA C967 or C1407 C5-methylase (RsmB/RsmF family)
LREQHTTTHPNNDNDDTQRIVSSSSMTTAATTTTTAAATTFSPHDRTTASLLVRSKLRNVNHETYYRLQCTNGNNAMTMSELETTLRYFRTPLPISFRLCRRVRRPPPHPHHSDDDDGHDHDAREEYIRYLLDTCTTIGQVQASPYFSSQSVQVASLPPREWTAIAQQALSDAQGVGAVYRQELCSVVPIKLVLLDLDNNNNNDDRDDDEDAALQMTTTTLPRRTILDLCAAPGSKTLLLLEELHRRHQSHQDVHSMVVANDSNRTRLVTLARLSRIALGRIHLILNSSDGRYFPSLRKWGGYKLKFDRILVDVPCSGDGTFRKLPEKDWKAWTVQTHLQLHKVQLRLLLRALQLVKKGGRVIYSTCSLDPIENEAVVASAIAIVGVDNYKIVPLPTNYHLDDDAQQPVSFSKGATKWSVPHPKFSYDNIYNNNHNNNNNMMYQRYEEVPADLNKRHILPTMFPPSTRIRSHDNRNDRLAMTRYSDGNGICCNDDENENNKDVNEDDDDDRNIEINEEEEENGNDCDDSSYKNDDGPNRHHQSRKWQSSSSSSPSSSSSARSIELRQRDGMMKLHHMLSNCCRILPQHLDSGGFFCAIIERIRPTYFAICCPSQRGTAARPSSSSSISLFHGRIYHPVNSEKQFRTMIQQERGRTGEEMYFEGHPTYESAIQWLHQHGAFCIDHSHILLNMPQQHQQQQHLPNKDEDFTVHEPPKGGEKIDEDEDDGDNAGAGATRRVYSTKEKVKVLNRTPIYTPLFRRPHPDLVDEFCNFYGLLQSTEEAIEAGVGIFPVEDIVLLGGTVKATEVTTCIDILATQQQEQQQQKVHFGDVVTDDGNDTSTIVTRGCRQYKFFQLSIVSKEIQGIYAGGAKFNPMEAGLVLTWVPIPDPAYNNGRRHHLNNNNIDNVPSSVLSNNTDNNRSSVCSSSFSSSVAEQPQHDPIPRSIKSGRYGLLDEAAEMVGRHATRRVLDLSTEDFIKLLQASSIHDVGTIEDWSTGGVIVRYTMLKDNSKSSAKIYVSCSLQRCDDTGKTVLYLLSEQRLAESWLRLVRARLEACSNL